MNTRHRSRWYWLSLFAVAVLLFFARSGATQKAPSKDSSTVETANGLTVVTFPLAPGNIIVKLPDDMMAGDTISGTVIEEPKGSNAQEKEKNKSTLDGLFIDLEGTKVPANQARFTWTPPVPSALPVRYHLRIVPAFPGLSADHSAE